MNARSRWTVLFAFLAFSSTALCESVPRARAITSFDPDWRFLKSDAPGADQPGFNDNAWRTLDVPHDWSIEGPFAESNPAGGAGAFLPDGIGWYRKHFTLPDADAKRRVFAAFDGVMANSDVWINGFHLGKRPYGYVSFQYDLTGHLNFGAGKTNVLSVRADNADEPASRWYSGAGIYRHVRLISTDPLHLDPTGTFVTTPQVSAASATVHVHNTVINQSDSAKEVTIHMILLGPDGKPAAENDSKPLNVGPGKSVDFEQDLSIKPQLWDIDHPVLYQAVSQVRAGGATLDDQVTSFGVRQFEFKSDTGFWLNGKNIKIKGVCIHQDMCGLGVAVPVGAWEHRLLVFKAMGCNAIRTAHHPFAPDFLDLCDRMGFLVMDEMFDCWTVAKNKYDYHLYFKDWSAIDTRDTVRRDRNHPSIILYSAGNEIHDTPKANIALPILKSLVATFHENDPTRPVTQALFRPNVSHDYDNGLADMLDVVGTNYRFAELIAAHQAKPTRKIIGTENGTDSKNWLAVKKTPAYSGYFVWAGADYLGESKKWPAVADAEGLLDMNDGMKSLAYEHQSWWSDQPMVAIVRGTSAGRAAAPTDGPADVPKLSMDWSPRDAAAHSETVEVYSNCDEIELFLNNKSLGAKRHAADAGGTQWKVAFEPGTLRAVGRIGGKEVAHHELRTAGAAARVMLVADHMKLAPTWDDVSYVTAMVVDANGVQLPLAADLISFKITGPGRIAALENADLTSHESFAPPQHHAYLGRCIAIVKATAVQGTIMLTASAPGLAEGSISIDVH